MENFAIVLSFPVSFICSIIYALVIGKIVKKWDQLSTPILLLSSIILTLAVIEFIGVVTVGTLKLRETIGVLYYPSHVFLFLFTLPSVTNVMKIQSRITFASRWYFIGLVCAFIGLGIVLLQYNISEALYGINGNDGPYSQL